MEEQLLHNRAHQWAVSQSSLSQSTDPDPPTGANGCVPIHGLLAEKAQSDAMPQSRWSTNQATPLSRPTPPDGRATSFLLPL